MAVLIPRKQLNGLIASKIGSLNYTFPAAATSDVTANLTTVLSTAANGGAAAPVTPSTGITIEGIITTGTNNRVIVRDAVTGDDVFSPAGDKVYGRITETTGVYSLALYTRIAGVETAYTPAAPVAIDYYFNYRFSMALLPTDFAISAPVSMDDDSSQVTTNQENYTELLTVTGTNTLSALTETPDDNTNVILIVNSASIDQFGGGSAPFSVSGTAVTWSATNAGFPLVPGDRVVASYTYEI